MVKTNAKKVVLLDADGVLADFVGCALDFVEKSIGRRFLPTDVQEWNIFASLGHPELWDSFNKHCENRGVCSGIEPYSQSIDPVSNLCSKHDVLVVTAPIYAEPWMLERALWIEKNYPIPRSKVIFAREKQHVRGDFLLDDKPENVSEWCESNPTSVGMLWNQPYNQGAVLPKNARRIFTWQKVIEIIEEG